ncbi:MAG: InlB B-repeat-containing protein [Lachnospiraceae bacterium]|nr:InlB B-repeat-containing protein [Lachnospiraceae bacterium]
MKTCKRLTAAFLAAVMVLMTAVPVQADIYGFGSGADSSDSRVEADSSAASPSETEKNPSEENASLEDNAESEVLSENSDAGDNGLADELEAGSSVSEEPLLSVSFEKPWYELRRPAAEAIKVDGAAEAYVFTPSSRFIKAVIHVNSIPENMGHANLYSVKDGVLGMPLTTARVGEDLTILLSEAQGIALAEGEVLMEEQTIPVSVGNGAAVSLSGELPAGADVSVAPAETDIEGALCAYDITINEGWQPEEGSPVEVTIADAALSGSASFAVYHLLEDGSRERVEISGIEEGKISFLARGFSVYVVTTLDPIRTYYFLKDTEKDDEGNWANEYTQYRQVLNNGDTLVEPTDPVENKRRFNCWHEVTVEGDNVSISNTEFNGWGTVSGIAANTTDQNGNEVQTQEKVYLAADFTDPTVTLTYYDQVGSIVETREYAAGTVLKPNDAENTDNYVAYIPIQNDEEGFIYFRYWTESPYGDQSKVESLTMDGDKKLYPIVGTSHHIYFDGNSSSINGTRSSYVGALNILPGTKPGNLTADKIPQANGYNFLGWYIKSYDSGLAEDCVFAADGTLYEDGWEKLITQTDKESQDLTYDPTLYAHWEVGTAPYTVVYYAQKSTCEAGVDPTETDYEFLKTFDPTDEEHEITLEAATGSAVNLETLRSLVAAQRGSWTDQEILEDAFTESTSTSYVKDRQGFQLSTVNVPTISVAADGSSVLRIYLDRKTITMSFTGYGEAEDTDYQYYRYYWRSVNSESALDNYNYNSRIVTTRTTLLYANGLLGGEIKALYGHSLENYFPIKLITRVTTKTREYENGAFTDWVESISDAVQSSCISWTETSGTNSFSELFTATGVMPPVNTTSKMSSSGTATKINYYYLEVIDEDEKTDEMVTIEDFSAETEKYRYFSDNNYDNGAEHVYKLERHVLHNFNFITYDEEFFDIEGFEQVAGYPPLSENYNGVMGTEAGLEGPYYLYYSRNKWTIHLINPMNGSDNRDVTYFYGEEIKASDDGMAYFPSVENVSLKNWRYYWYYDKECTDPVIFDDDDAGTELLMPNHDMTFYAGLKKEYRVEVFPDGGELEHGISTGNDYSSFFWVDEGETIVEYSNIARDYVQVADDYTSDDEEIFWYEKHPYIGEDKVNWDNQQTFYKYWVKDAEHQDEDSYIKSIGAYSLIGWYDISDYVQYDEENESFTSNYDADAGAYPEGAAPLMDPRTDPIPEEAGLFDFTSPIENIEHSIYMKAKWRPMSEFRIIYDADDGSTAVRAPEDPDAYVVGASVAIQASVDQPDGKQFRGWKDSDGNIYQPNSYLTVSEAISTANTDGSRTITLTAVYEAGEFKDNYTAGYTFKNGDTVYFVEMISPGEELVMPDAPEGSGVNEGKRFSGWYLDPDCTKPFNGFGVVSVPKDTVLYAGYKQFFTVTYYDAKLVSEDWAQGDNILATELYADGDILSTTGVRYEIDSDRYVKYWHLFDEDENEILDGTEPKEVPYVSTATATTVDKNLVLWPEMGDYTYLYFETNGGSYVDPLQIPTDDTHWAHRPVEPTRAGYQFLGWFVKKEFTLDSNGDPDRNYEFDFDEFTSSRSDLLENTLYAWWKPVGSTSSTARYTVIWWTQTADGGNAYEYQTSQSYEGTIGSTVDVTSSGWIAEHEDPTDVNSTHLPSYYDADTSTDNTKYFSYTAPGDTAYGTPSEVSTIIEDDGKSVINIRFHRSRYKMVFDTQVHSTAIGYPETNYVSYIHYKGDIYDNQDDNKYTINDVWFGRPIADFWPIVDQTRSSAEGEPKPWLELNTQGTYNRFHAWRTNMNYNSLPAVVNGTMLDQADTSNTVTFALIQSNNTADVNVHYYFKEINGGNYSEKEEYAQTLTANSAIFTEPQTDPSKEGIFKFQPSEGTVKYFLYCFLRAKDFDGYHVVGYLPTVSSEDITESSYCMILGSNGYAWGEYSGPETTDNSLTERNLSFYYRPKTYTIELHQNDGDLYETIDVDYGDTIQDKIEAVTVPDAPSTDLVFDCWSVTNLNPQSYTSTYTDNKMPASNIPLYATWKTREVTITTEGCDQEGNETDVESSYGTYTEAHGSLFTTFEVKNPRTNRKGVSFGGWEDTTTADKYSVNDIINEDITIRPIWIDKHVPSPVYVYNEGTLIDSESGISGTTAVSGYTDRVQDSASYLSGAKALVKDGSVLARSNGDRRYEFICWNTDPNGQGIDYYPGETVTLTTDGVVLYARYADVREVTLVYHLNNVAGDGAEFVAKEDGVNLDITDYGTEENPESVISIFFANYLNVNNRDMYPNTAYPVNKDKNEKEFTVSRPGWKFLYWYTNESASVEGGTKIYPDDGDIRVNTLGQDDQNRVHLYGQWETVKLPVTVYQDSAELSVKEGQNAYVELTSVAEDQVYTINADALASLYDVANKYTLSSDPAAQFVKGAVSSDTGKQMVTNVKFNKASNVWQYSYDGSTYTDFGDSKLELYYTTSDLPAPTGSRLPWLPWVVMIGLAAVVTLVTRKLRVQ